jgi:solute carrier family 25 carnitine/acylcarnitine transporter 20/29
MQTDAIDLSQRQFKSTLGCVKHIYRTAGLSGFFRGLMPTLVRVSLFFSFPLRFLFHVVLIHLATSASFLSKAPIANAATFVVYEYASQNLESYVAQ